MCFWYSNVTLYSLHIVINYLNGYKDFQLIIQLIYFDAIYTQMQKYRTHFNYFYLYIDKT